MELYVRIHRREEQTLGARLGEARRRAKERGKRERESDSERGSDKRPSLKFTQAPGVPLAALASDLKDEENHEQAILGEKERER